MSTKQKIWVFLYLLLSIPLFAKSETETIYNADLQILDGTTTTQEIKLLRGFSNGVIEIKLKPKGILKDFYIFNKEESDTEYLVNSDLDFESNEDEINLEIISVKSITYSGDLTILKYKPKTVTLNYSDQVITKAIWLIDKDNVDKSFQIELKINPSIDINLEETVTPEQMETYLIRNPAAKRFLKKQLMGSTTFSPTSTNPFPIANITNEKFYKVSSELFNSKMIIKRELERTDINYFDSIYNNTISSNSEFADSIIQRLLRIYFNKNKPLFHSYINNFMEYKFDYNQYEKLTAIQGKELADSALKYLTWGVEYTNDVNYRELSSGSKFPSEIIKNSPTLQQWLSGVQVELETNQTGEIVNSLDPTYTSEQIEYFKTIIRERNLNITTPFNSITGSSLPYAKDGIDNPRTFNYKLLRQKEVIKRVFNRFKYRTYGKNGKVNPTLFSFKSSGVSTPKISDYYFFLNDGTTNLNSDSPFFPGLTDDNSYKGLNITGVDSLGLLSGALSKTTYKDDILGLDNESKLEELDSYYRTTIPTFKINPETNIDYMRLSRFDLERTTVIVPDLNKIQVGDLLVKGLDSTEIAIVIDVGVQSSTNSFDIGKVLVLSVTKDNGRVSLNYWGNSGNNYSFTTEPKNFILRRLIKFNRTEENPEINTFTRDDSEADTWDPFVFQPEPLVTQFDINSLQNNSRWIPNTGELFQLNSIKIGYNDDAGIFTEIDESNISVIIEPPSDLNFTVESKTTNILNNRGDGFAFYAVKHRKLFGRKYYDAVRLATFTINPMATNQSDNYLISYDDDIFTEEGLCRVPYKLVYVKNVGLTFKTGRTEDYTQFAIRPLEQNIRTGDDILLNFTLQIENNYVPVKTEDKNFLGVYDEKLLWRANLYIDDPGRDWNNINPWNSPQTSNDAEIYGPILDNNVTKRFFKNNRSSTIDRVWYGPNLWNTPPENYNKIKGGQIIKIVKYSNIFGGDTPYSVAYSYPDTASTKNGRDTPFDFNNKLNEQKKLLEDAYNSGGIKLSTTPNNTSPWTKITPPKEKWSNYLTNDATIGDNSYTPYLPGLGLIEWYSKNTNIQASTQFINSIYVGNGLGIGKYKEVKWPKRFAGTDCIGFAQNAANIDQYKWNIPPTGNSSYTSTPIFRTYPRTKEDAELGSWTAFSDFIVGKSNTEVDDDDDYIIKGNINSVKPGDIFYHIGIPNSPQSGSGKHVGIVLSIENNNLKIIESTYNEGDSNLSYVIDTRNLAYYNHKHWRLVRLKK
ncbi:MAG: hypothetical protein OCD02_16895 [Spirochaetaceae bacterium]